MKHVRYIISIMRGLHCVADSLKCEDKLYRIAVDVFGLHLRELDASDSLFYGELVLIGKSEDC